MSHSADTSSKTEQLLAISSFVSQSAGLSSKVSDQVIIQIFQRADGKTMSFAVADLEEVIARTDSEGQQFLQVNFLSGKKILITDNLVGFKPAQSLGLDMTKLPKVVTTPDLISVVDAIEDTISGGPAGMEEVDVLKKVFDAVLRGAEAVGFDITSERIWLQNIDRPERANA